MGGRCVFQEKVLTLLELLGERNERVEQLDLDCQEMRAVYKDQISALADHVIPL